MAVTYWGSTSMCEARAPRTEGLKNSGLSRPRSTAWVPSAKPSPSSFNCRSTSSLDSRSARIRCSAVRSRSTCPSSLWIERSCSSVSFASSCFAFKAATPFSTWEWTSASCRFTRSSPAASCWISGSKIPIRVSLPSLILRMLEISPRNEFKRLSMRLSDPETVCSSASVSIRSARAALTALIFSSSRFSSKIRVLAICSISRSVFWI